MMSRWLRISAVVCLLCVPASAAGFTYVTDCLTSRVVGFEGVPFPVLAGMTRLGVSGVGAGYVGHESQFDGANDFMSAPVNTLAGAVDCDQDPDFHVQWGYSFFDSTALEDDFLRLTVTLYSRDVGSAQPCNFVSNPSVIVHDLATGPPVASLWQEAATVGWSLNGTCVAGRFFQLRVRALAEEDFQPDAWADGCFMIQETGSCPGGGPVCL